MYLCSALAVQRYIFVCHPVAAKTWCTVSKSSALVLALVTLALATSSSRVVEKIYSTVQTGKHYLLMLGTFTTYTDVNI